MPPSISELDERHLKRSQAEAQENESSDLYTELATLLDPRTGHRHLDISIGTGKLLAALHALQPAAILMGVERNLLLIEEAQRHLTPQIELTHGDVREMAVRALFDGKKFDSVSFVHKKLSHSIMLQKPFPPTEEPGMMQERFDQAAQSYEMAALNLAREILRPGGKLLYATGTVTETDKPFMIDDRIAEMFFQGVLANMKQFYRQQNWEHLAGFIRHDGPGGLIEGEVALRIYQLLTPKA